MAMARVAEFRNLIIGSWSYFLLPRDIYNIYLYIYMNENIYIYIYI